MLAKLKYVWEHLFRLQFWSILFLETTIIGIVLVYIDYLYDDHFIPYMLVSLSFPFFGLFMIVGGIYSSIRLFIRIDLFSILINAAIWMYIAAACLIDMIQSEYLGHQGFTAILFVLSIALCIRILGNAYYLDLHKEKRISQERDNGELE